MTSHSIPSYQVSKQADPCADGEIGRVTSEALLGPRKELVIVHGGREYHLRLTQNGKLILTA
jgi:hemin uptake protein HemP